MVPFFSPFVRSNEFYLAKTLAEFGHETTVITSTAKAPREYQGQKRVSDAPFQLKYTPTLLNRVFSFAENPLTPFVWRDLDDSYDIIHLQEDFPLICQLAFCYAGRHSISTVMSSERYYYPAGLIKKSALSILDRTVHKRMWRKLNAITTHTSEARRFFCARGVNEERIKVISDGVDSKLFKYQQGNFLQNHFGIDQGTVILCVARLHPYKGLARLIQAMGIVSAECPESYLVIMGRGKEKEHLAALVKSLNLQKKVFFLEPEVPNKEMPKVYSSADIYVQPSIIEPFGIAVLEAMACSRAIIGSQTGGMKDTIEDGKTGLLVPPGNVHELAQALIALIRDKGRRQEMGQNARKRVESLFDWQVITRQYLELYEQLVK